MDGIKQEIHDIETVTKNLNHLIRENAHKGTFTKPDIIQITWAIDLLNTYKNLLTWEDPNDKKSGQCTYGNDNGQPNKRNGSELLGDHPETGTK